MNWHDILQTMGDHPIVAVTAICVMALLGVLAWRD